MEAIVRIKTIAGEHKVTTQTGTLLSKLLDSTKHPIDLPCGGGGRCGHCRVRVAGSLSPPAQEEIEALGADLKKGWRLACVTLVAGDCTVWLDVPAHAAHGFATAVVDGIESVRGNYPLYQGYGLAVDVGTTTIAAKLYSANSMVAVATAKNPQTAFGADVISRIGHALNGGIHALQAAIQQALAALVEELCTGAGCCSNEIDAGVITGNTAMLYLLTGRLPSSIAAAPFVADWLAGESIPASHIGLQLAAGAQVYLPPCISAFVGADITTAVLASAMTDSGQTSLLVDIGTNGEAVLWHDGILTCCATAAGPAFEGAGIACGMHGITGAIDHVTVVDGQLVFTVIGGGVAKGLCGSAVIDTVAAMRILGLVDETGYIEADKESFALCDGVFFSQVDVRAVQLAKSAICSGLETLVHSAGLALPQVDVLYVAGGFGSYLNMGTATDIGLVPQQLRHCATTIGNAALSGAVMLLGDSRLVEKVQKLAQLAKTIDLTANADFFARYIQNMGFL